MWSSESSGTHSSMKDRTLFYKPRHSGTEQDVAFKITLLIKQQIKDVTLQFCLILNWLSTRPAQPKASCQVPCPLLPSSSPHLGPPPSAHPSPPIQDRFLSVVLSMGLLALCSTVGHVLQLSEPPFPCPNENLNHSTSAKALESLLPCLLIRQPVNCVPEKVTKKF